MYYRFHVHSHKEMNFFFELRHQGKLSARRNPMFEKNRFAKVFVYIGIAFWACYLIFFGFTLAQNLGNGGHEAYQTINSGLIFILALDFLLRFPFLQTPTQEVKPYLLLPVHKQRIIDFLLIRSGLSLYNLFWGFFFVPFACISLFRFFGITGIICYLFGIWLLFVINNYWFMLCRTLMNIHMLWTLLPVMAYGIISAVFFIPKNKFIENLFIDLGDGYIKFNPLVLLATFLIIALLWKLNSHIMSRQIYKELNKVDDTSIKHLSEYRFLDRYGTLGDFMRLELKLLFRNRVPKISVRNILLISIFFAGSMSFTPAYNDHFGRIFVTTYSFCSVGVTLLLKLMSFEGNYIDGLMTRKECILTLLRAKYILSCAYLLIPLLILIPAIVQNKVSILFILSMAFFTAGPIYFTLFQTAIYNTQTTPLNRKLAQRQSATGIQWIVSTISLALPLTLYTFLENVYNNNYADLILLIIGLGFTITSNLWLRNIYKRFMKRRYVNIESFHDSREDV